MPRKRLLEFSDQELVELVDQNPFGASIKRLWCTAKPTRSPDKTTWDRMSRALNRLWRYNKIRRVEERGLITYYPVERKAETHDS